jgi:hypothetical protein
MVAQSVAEILDNHVSLSVEGIDRMYLNVYVPSLQRDKDVAWFFRGHRRQPFASSALMAPMSRRFVAKLERHACKHGIEVVRFRPGERKDDVMAERLKRFDRAEGVVFIGKAQEKTAVFRTEKRRSPNGRSYPWIVRSSALVNHYYIYAVDRDFGPFFLKFGSYFPYTAKLCLNGHEYAKRQLAREGIAFTALDNGIQACADPQRLQAICDGLSADKIDALLRKWLRRLPHPFTADDRQAGYRYDISILQAEFALTQVLDKPAHGRLFFEQVIRENLDLGRPDQVQLIFDRRIIRRTPGRFRTRVLTRGVTPSLHIDYKRSRIKQYHKEGRALRTETTINNAPDFGVGKRLANLPTLRRIGFAANRRLLATERLSHNCMLAETTFQAIERPVSRDGQRISGLRFADPKVHNLWHALLLFRLIAGGFRSADLRHHLADLEGRPAHDIGRGAMTYQLRRLRLHGMIERIPQSHRYRVTDLGWRSALFFTRTYNRLLRPGMAAVLPRQAARSAPLSRAFDVLDRRIQQSLAQNFLAA